MQMVLSPGEPAPPALAPIWPRIQQILAHLAALRLDEPAMQAQQRAALRDGRVLLPSLYPGRDSDACHQSWFFEDQVYFQFDAGPHGQHYAVTGLLDRGYSLDTIWFPQHGAAVTNCPIQIDGAKLERAHAMLAAAPKPPPGPDTPRLALGGFPHIMHVLWNELPALEQLETEGLPPGVPLTIGALFQPFGPMAALFPGLALHLRPMSLSGIPAANAAYGLVAALGAWQIPATVQDRVLALCRQHAAPAVLAARDRFRARHPAALWISVKPPNRTPSHQADALVALVTALAERHPAHGFILDGVSLPWDYPANPNYEPWFHDALRSATEGSAAILADITARLPPDVLQRTIRLNGLSVCNEAMWGEAATFYVCHGGTMHNKIGWLHRIPGFVHSNTAFLESMRWSPNPVPHSPPCHLATPALIQDDEPAAYTALQLARKDQNYTFTSQSRLLQEIIAALEA